MYNKRGIEVNQSGQVKDCNDGQITYSGSSFREIKGKSRTTQ